jgi:type I restriction enzyme, S subunit
MDTIQKHEKYKDSEVEWIGKIPYNWKVSRLKNAVDSCINGVWGDEPNGENDIVCIRVADFQRYNFTVSLKNNTLRHISENDFKTRSLKPGDLLLEKSGGGEKQLVGQVVSFKHDMKAVCSNFVARMRIDGNFDSRFIAYFNAYLYSISINYRHIKQTTGIQNLDSHSYLNERIVYPNKKEQERIATFLDQKTTEIDKAIAKKQRLIELLQEQKAILINQAVTRGLNPDVPLRDSGVEWIGEIPAHWEIKKNRYLFFEQNERSEKGEEIHLSMSQKLGLVPSDELDVQTLQSESYEGAKLCLKGDLVLNRLKAHLAVFSVAPTNGLVSSDYSVFRLKNTEFRSHYFENLFKIPIYLTEFNKRVRGIVIGFYRLYSDDFKDISGIVPPKEEQREIVGYILNLKKDIDLAKVSIQKEISALEELKSILISDAVTGKIKV